MAAGLGTISFFSEVLVAEREQNARRRWLWSLGLTLLVYSLLVVVVAWMGFGSKPPPPEVPVEVTFQERVAPPPPPPPVEPLVAAPEPVAAPPVPKHLKVRKVEAPPKPKPLTSPKEIPMKPPAEADPAEDRGVAVAGDPSAGGDPAGLEGGRAGTMASAEPIALPEDADPPVPLADNPVPEYPSEARAAGKTGLVVLKVVIGTDGIVRHVELLRGEEPFVSAAMQAVRRWKYRPARYKGQPIVVYRIVQIPFKLRA